MRIVAIADAHVDATMVGGWIRSEGKLLDHSNWIEAQRQLRAAVDIANEVDADLLTISGDVYHTGKPLPELVARTHETLSHLTRAKVVATDGNHDQSGILGDHRTPLGAYMASQPWCYAVQDLPGIVDYQGFRIASVPWPRVAGSRSLEDVEQKARDEIARMADQLATGGPSILIGHLTVSEASFSSGRRSSETTMSISTQEATIPSSVLDDGPWSVAALGHIHKRQQMTDSTIYLGSTYKVTFGEMQERKGCTVIDVEEDGGWSWEFRPFDVRELALLDISAEGARLRASAVENYRAGDILRVVVQDASSIDGRSAKVIEDLKARGCEVSIQQVAQTIAAPATRSSVTSTLMSSPADAMREYASKNISSVDEIDRVMEVFEEILSRSDATD